MEIFPLERRWWPECQQSQYRSRTTSTPSGVVVRCQERAQSKSKQRTYAPQFKTDLGAKESRRQELKLQTEKGEHTQTSWGTQIRNYVLHPYKLVKKIHALVLNLPKLNKVLDGDLDAFIDAAVRL